MKRALIVLLLLLAGCAPPGDYSGATTPAGQNVSVLSISYSPYYRITDLDNKVVCWGSSQAIACKTFEEMGK